MPQATGDPMAFHRGPHRLGNDQADVGRAGINDLVAVPSPEMDDQIGLRRAQPVPHRRVKLG